MLIKEPVHTYRQGGINDVPEMLLVVQLIEIAPDSIILCACQLHGVGQYLVAGLLPVEPPCIVLPGIFQKHITFPEAVRPGGPGHPQQGLVHGLIAGGGPLDNTLVNVKVALIKRGVLPHDLTQRRNHVHILKLLHPLDLQFL